MNKIRTSSIMGIGGVHAALATGLGKINHTWQRGSEPWKLHTNRAMQAAVREIRQGIRLGTIDADKGQREINRLLGNIKLRKGSDPFGVAEATVKQFKEANGITASGVAEWVR